LFSDILSPGPEQLDELLNICGTALLGDEVKGELQSIFKHWFLTPIVGYDRYDATFPLHLEPLPPLRRTQIMKKCRAENQIGHSEEGEKENVVIHGGEEYALYSSQDSLGEVGETYGHLLGAVAAWCGVTRDDVLGVTEALERRLVRHLERGVGVGVREGNREWVDTSEQGPLG
jgi:hypothetical protein